VTFGVSRGIAAELRVDFSSATGPGAELGFGTDDCYVDLGLGAETARDADVMLQLL
jgi:hypothetical protein